MKKTSFIFICLVLLISLLPSCEKSVKEQSKKINIIATVFPAYDWARNVIGEDSESVSVSMLIENGVDLHSYQPSAKDIVKISTCDMFIYVGGESDKWVSDALKEKKNNDMIVVSLIEALGDSAKEETVPEGADTNEEEEEEEEKEYDEHVWLSLKNAVKLCGHICEKICVLDGKNADRYRLNTQKYVGKLKTLDESYGSAIRNAKTKTLVFGDRFPFGYLADDYGLKCYAAFAGCSAETEASFKTIVFLAEKVDEFSLKTILKIETSDGSVADAVKNATKSKDQKILTLDSLQSVSAKEAENSSYLYEMEKNLEALKEALEQ